MNPLVGRLRAVVRRSGPRPDVVNVIGYFGAPTGLGERARELAAALEAAGVTVRRWDATTGQDEAQGERQVGATTVAVVTAVQMAAAREVCPGPFEQAHRTIGYFFWELDVVPDEQQWGIGLVDEIWTPTEFVRSAYAAATDRPVRLAAIPIVDHGVPATGGDRPFTFLTAFDHRSVMRRKNPIGVVVAFRRAFPDDGATAGGGVALRIKSVHGSERPDAVERLHRAIGDDRRIEVVDDDLGRGEHLALLASSDAFVSLHRSEGLGLHLAEAMWCGVPVVATRYSGSMDLVDDSCAALVGWSPVRVGDGPGDDGNSGADGAYSATATWADPDLDEAAALMSRLVVDDAWRRSLVEAGRARMERQPSRAATGRQLAALLGLRSA